MFYKSPTVVIYDKNLSPRKCQKYLNCIIRVLGHYVTRLLSFLSAFPNATQPRPSVTSPLAGSGILGEPEEPQIPSHSASPSALLPPAGGSSL